MTYENDRYAELLFPGLGSLYEARETMIQECARIDINAEIDAYLGCKVNEKAKDDHRRYIEAISKMRALIQWIIPGWEHDPEGIVDSLTSVMFVRRDAWGGEFDKWECGLSVDGEKFECIKPEVLWPFPSDNAGQCPTYGEVSCADFLLKLKALNVSAWKPRYEPDPSVRVLDGDSWELRLESPRGYIFSTGNNAYPDELDDLCDYLDSICANVSYDEEKSE